MLQEEAVLKSTVAMCAAAAGFILCIMSFLGIWQTRRRATFQVCNHALVTCLSARAIFQCPPQQLMLPAMESSHLSVLVLSYGRFGCRDDVIRLPVVTLYPTAGSTEDTVLVTE